MKKPIYDNQEDVWTIDELLLPEEELDAVFDQTPTKDKQRINEQNITVRLLAITSKRVIWYRYQTGREYIEKYESVPFSEIDSLNLSSSARGFILAIEHGRSSAQYGFAESSRARLAYNLILAHLI